MLKASEQCPRTHAAIARALVDAGLPAGTVNLIIHSAEDAPDVVNLVFENSGSDRISEYDIKLMDIDQEHLGIPETEYAATITMPSAEFQRICRDLSALSESGTLS